MANFRLRRNHPAVPQTPLPSSNRLEGSGVGDAGNESVAAPANKLVAVPGVGAVQVFPQVVHSRLSNSKVGAQICGERLELQELKVIEVKPPLPWAA